MTGPRSSRRSILRGGVVAGGALLLGFKIEAAVRKSGRGNATAFAPNAFLRIDENGRTTAIVSPTEMGQGIHTALAMVLAEELDVAWEQIQVEPAPADPTLYGNPILNGLQTTEASVSMAGFYGTTRLAAGAARLMLMRAAAAQWNVSVEQLRTENSHVIGWGNKRCSYGSLVQAARALKPPVEKDIILKTPDKFKLVGQSMPRLGLRDYVTGNLAYGVDMRLPGMLVAVVTRRLMVGARLIKYDASVSRLPGVRAVVEIPSGVAIIAANYWSALSAREVLAVEWDYDGLDHFTAQDVQERLAALARTPGVQVERRGKPEPALDSEDVITAEYTVPYLTHAPMEPLNCTIDANNERVDVWVGSQDQGFHQEVVAKRLGRALSDVNIRTLPMGGGFGRRGSPDGDFVAETAEIVKATKHLGVPIRNMWLRADDLQGGFYRPMAVNQLSAVLKDGSLHAWRHRIASRSPLAGTQFAFLVANGIDASQVAGARDLPYAVPNFQCELHSPTFGPTVGWMRSVGNSNAAYAIESFIDELAARAGTDPVKFRRRLLAAQPGSERLLNTLNLAAQYSGWSEPLPPHRGRGIATHDYWGTKATQVVEVTVDGDRLTVNRVSCVIDCGLAINPDGVKAQVEGAIIFGLSAALYGEVTFAGGVPEQTNFDNYPILRMDASPVIDVHVVASQERPGGVGEVGVPHIAPAVCNAIFAACGRRIRTLPIVKSGITI